MCMQFISSATVYSTANAPMPCFLQSAHDASAAVPPQQQHYMPATYYGQYAQYPVYPYPQASYNVPTKFNAGYMYTPPATSGASTKGTQVCRTRIHVTCRRVCVCIRV